MQAEEDAEEARQLAAEHERAAVVEAVRATMLGGAAHLKAFLPKGVLRDAGELAALERGRSGVAPTPPPL